MIDYTLLLDSLPSLFKGACMSMLIALLSCGIGLSLGTLIGITYLGSSKWIRWFNDSYVAVFRGTPMLVQIMFVFYVLPEMGIHLPAIWCAILAIGLNSSAYISQIILSGINAIPKGQIEAAKALGMSDWQTKRHIILPQVFQITFPSLGNEFVTLIKDSSLASVVGVVELTKEGSIIRSQTYDAFTVLIAVSVLYFLMTSSLSFFIGKIKKKAISYV